MSTFGPGDALWEKQIQDLAWLYCRRESLERAQAGLKRRALQVIDDRQHHRQQEMARVTFDASQHGVLDEARPHWVEANKLLSQRDRSAVPALWSAGADAVPRRPKQTSCLLTSGTR
jgi:glutamate mutase epsilon subunit